MKTTLPYIRSSHSAFIRNLTLTALALMTCAAEVEAAPIVSDGVPLSTGGYTTGATNTQNPTATTGFNGAWRNGTGTTVVSTGLTYGSLVTSGGAINLGSNGRSIRSLSAAVPNTGTTYISFLWDTTTGANADYFNGAPNPGALTVGMHAGGDGTDNATWDLGNTGGNSNFRLRTYTNNRFPWESGGTTTFNLGADDFVTNFFVIKFVLSATAASDSITVWRNPSNLNAEPITGGVTVSGLNFGSKFGGNGAGDRLVLSSFFGANRPVAQIDEFRIGSTWSNAVVVPEPSSILLLIGGGAMLLFRRRRVS